jgi:hypothetical protein
MTRAARDGRSARVMPWKGVRTSNTGRSTGPLTRTQMTAAVMSCAAVSARNVGSISAGGWPETAAKVEAASAKLPTPLRWTMTSWSAGHGSDICGLQDRGTVSGDLALGAPLDTACVGKDENLGICTPGFRLSSARPAAPTIPQHSPPMRDMTVVGGCGPTTHYAATRFGW